MIVLDTDVISEVFRPQPEHAVVIWHLPLEGEVTITAVTLAEILRARDRAGHAISTADAQIAAIYRAHTATLATRTTQNFAHTGVDLINPWEY